MTMRRAPARRSASGSRCAPTRSSRPRREAPASRLPFRMKPIPPNILISVTAPAPATAARTRDCNCSASIGLFRVLHLLAHLLDQHLHVHRGARGLEVLRLGRQRVGLAVQLLHEEIEPPAGGLVAADDAG